MESASIRLGEQSKDLILITIAVRFGTAREMAETKV